MFGLQVVAASDYSHIAKVASATVRAGDHSFTIILSSPSATCALLLAVTLSPRARNRLRGVLVPARFFDNGITIRHATRTPEISVTSVTLRRPCDRPYMGQKR